MKHIPTERPSTTTRYRISAVRGGGLLDSCGLRNGDVVHTINGTAVDSMEAAMAVVKRLEGEPGDLTLTLTREDAMVEVVLHAPAD